MFGNKPKPGEDADKKKDDDKKDAQSFEDFSDDDKEDLKQSKPDTVVINPGVKDLIEKVMTMRKKGA